MRVVNSDSCSCAYRAVVRNRADRHREQTSKIITLGTHSKVSHCRCSAIEHLFYLCRRADQQQGNSAASSICGEKQSACLFVCFFLFWTRIFFAIFTLWVFLFAHTFPPPLILPCYGMSSICEDVNTAFTFFWRFRRSFGSTRARVG